MPLDPITLSAIIAGGSAVLSTGANAAAGGAQNRRSRAFSREMYSRQLADNLTFWEMQNAYNHPSQQKQRLKDAGLNPALLYGGSAAGASGTAGALSAPTAMRPEFNAPDFSGIADAGQAYANRILQKYDREIKKEQAENMKVQNEHLREQNKLLKIQQNKEQFNLDLEMEARPITMASREATLRKLNADITFTIDSNDRAALKNASDIAVATEQILTAHIGREYTAQLIETEVVKRALLQSDLELRKQGVSYNDPLWARMLAKYLETHVLPAARKAVNLIKPSSRPHVSYSKSIPVHPTHRLKMWWNKNRLGLVIPK